MLLLPYQQNRIINHASSLWHLHRLDIRNLPGPQRQQHERKFQNYERNASLLLMMLIVTFFFDLAFKNNANSEDASQGNSEDEETQENSNSNANQDPPSRFCQAIQNATVATTPPSRRAQFPHHHHGMPYQRKRRKRQKSILKPDDDTEGRSIAPDVQREGRHSKTNVSFNDTIGIQYHPRQFSSSPSSSSLSSHEDIVKLWHCEISSHFYNRLRFFLLITIRNTERHVERNQTGTVLINLQIASTTNQNKPINITAIIAHNDCFQFPYFRKPRLPPTAPQPTYKDRLDRRKNRKNYLTNSNLHESIWNTEKLST